MWEILGKILKKDFIPSVAFSSLLLLTFGPILPPFLYTRLGGDYDLFSQAGLIIIGSSVIIGFTLSGLSNFIYSFFAGYVGLDKIPLFRRRYVKRALKLRAKMKRLQRKIDRAIESSTSGDSIIQKKLITHIGILDSVRGFYDNQYPFDDKIVRPTTFGNIMAASMCYSLERYNIDHEIVWPRLYPILPENIKTQISNADIDCSFFLNNSFLSMIFAVISAFTAIFQFVLYKSALLNKNELLYFLVIDRLPYIYLQRVWIYLAIAITAVIVSRFFYRSSLSSANLYYSLIRAAYDLYRFSLLGHLRRHLPKDLTEERFLWQEICRMLSLGDAGAPYRKFKYLHKKGEENLENV